MTEEQWRPVVGYEGLYEVSDLGRVRSLPRPRTKGGIRKTRVIPAGYLIVGLYLRGVETTRAVHVLVMRAFVGPRPDGTEIRHLDGNPQNARLDNLAYGTSSENSWDILRHGRHNQANKTHCPSGHPYDDENTYVLPSRPTARYCRACQSERRPEENRRARERRAQARLSA